MTAVSYPFRLVRVDGPTLAAEAWPLRTPFALGRASDSDLLLVDPTVARRHARIDAGADGWRVADCGSRLGTWLNALRVAIDDDTALLLLARC